MCSRPGCKESKSVARHAWSIVNSAAQRFLFAFRGMTSQDKWPELLPTLLGNVTGEFEKRVKVATLQALGYMCDDVSVPPQAVVNR